MDTGHFFGTASNPTQLRLTRDPTRPGSIKMQCVMLLYACKNNMKPLSTLSLLFQCSTHDETEEFTLATSRGRNTQDT